MEELLKQRIEGQRSSTSCRIRSCFADWVAPWRTSCPSLVRGYVVNIAETTSQENRTEFITDYKVAKNTTSDIDILTERLPELAERTGVKDIYADGGYYGPAAEDAAEEAGVSMH